MIKKFEEFVNEGIITDYQKQVEIKNKELSRGEKKFVLDLINKLHSVDMPFAFTCKNCEIISTNVDEDKLGPIRNRVYNTDELVNISEKDIHVSSMSAITIFDDGADEVKTNEYKNIWKSIYKWFEKRYEKEELSFDGTITAGRILEFKKDIKKELM